MNSSTRKVGRITVALGLVALGTALLLDNLLGTSPAYKGLILRFWPVLLIGFGVEYLVLSLVDRLREGEPLRLRFDFVGALLLFMLVGMTAGFQTLSTWISLDARDYVLMSDRAKRTESLSTSAEGAKELVVTVESGQVNLYSQRLSEVRVEAEYGLNGLLLMRDDAQAIDRFNLTLEGGERIQVVGKSPDRATMGGLAAAYRIYAPEGLAVKVETGAGSISVQDYRGELNLMTKVGSINVEASEGSLEAETNSGSIRVADFIGPVNAKTNVGSVNLYRVSGDLQLDSGSGMISVREYGDGKLAAETRTGSISVQTSLPLAGDMELRTSTGSITLDLPEELDAKVSAQTRTGSISVPPFISINQTGATSRSAEWTSGSGKYSVNLEANLGSITILTRQSGPEVTPPLPPPVR